VSDAARHLARAEPQRPGEFVQSLERGLAVIRAFGPGRSQLTLSEVAKVTGLTRAAARRFLLTLVHLDYVHFDGRAFSLRPRVLELGYAYLSTLSLPEVAVPHLEELVTAVHESSSVAVLDGDDIVYVARVPTRRIMAVAITVGTRFPAYATSMGRVLLAALPPEELDRFLQRVDLRPLTRRTVTDVAALRKVLAEVASHGYAVVNQELEEGLRSAAAPIVDAAGTVTAAVNLSTHASRVTFDTLRRVYLPALLDTAAAISADLTALRVPIDSRPSRATRR
jgi:IclR family pca regulon transcriptional regulator